MPMTYKEVWNARCHERRDVRSQTAENRANAALNAAEEVSLLLIRSRWM